MEKTGLCQGCVQTCYGGANSCEQLSEWSSCAVWQLRLYISAMSSTPKSVVDETGKSGKSLIEFMDLA